MTIKGPALSSETPLVQPEITARAPLAVSDLPLHEAYEVDSTCSQILQGDFHKVALQFPDELLHDSVPVYQAIRGRLPVEIELYVLADTTFGSCCVDEVAAEHVNADLVVHYGHACMSPTTRLPVIYVFGKKAIDTSHAAQELARVAQEHLRHRKAAVLIFDVAYEWKAEDIGQRLESLLDVPVVVSRIERSAVAKGKTRETVNASTCTSCACTSSSCCTRPQRSADEGTSVQSDSRSRRRISLPDDVELSDCAILYLGDESLSLTNLLMTHPSTPVISYSPTSRAARLESGKTNRMLMRRYVAAQKAKDADVFGIVVGTLGVASYLPLISRLRALLRKHQKKAYTLAVGKLNPAKLANYQEIECFVLVACGENSLVERAKDFYRPIVTPFELEVALGERPWTGSDYVLNFGELLSRRDEATNGDAVEEEDDAPIFSSVTGKYRTPKRFGDTILDPDLGTLSVREGGRAIAEAIGSAAGLHLADRSYRGLEARFGEDAPAVVEQGRSGLAREYGDDHRTSA